MKTYRNWHVVYDPPPIPWRGADWQATGDGWEPGDWRHATAATEEELHREIDAMIEENEGG